MRQRYTPADARTPREFLPSHARECRPAGWMPSTSVATRRPARSNTSTRTGERTGRSWDSASPARAEPGGLEFIGYSPSTSRNQSRTNPSAAVVGVKSASRCSPQNVESPWSRCAETDIDNAACGQFDGALRCEQCSEVSALARTHLRCRGARRGDEPLRRGQHPLPFGVVHRHQPRVVDAQAPHPGATHADPSGLAIPHRPMRQQDAIGADLARRDVGEQRVKLWTPSSHHS